MAFTISSTQRAIGAVSTLAESSAPNQISGRITLLRNCLIGLTSLGFVMQMLVAPSTENRIASLLAAAGAILVCIDACRYSRFIFYPLSTLILLGFGIVLNLTPLLITAIEGKPIVFNLYNPEYTFLHIFLITLIAIASHAAYRNLLPLASLRLAVQRLITRLYVFNPLTFREAILFTAIGCIADLFTRDVFGSDSAVGAEPPLIKFIQGFNFLIVVPAVYYLQHLWTKSSIRGRAFNSPLVALLISTILILLTAILGNRRSAFIAPLSTLAFGLGLAALYGLFRITLAKILAILLAIFILLPLASDLSSAMRMARSMGYRDASSQEILSKTLENLSDRDSLRRFQESVNDAYISSTLWDMGYYENEMLSRLANIKVVDTSLQLHRETDNAGRREMLSYHINRFFSQLPLPLFTAIGLPAELKRETLSTSWGDKQLNTALGYPVYTSMRVTHFGGTGMSAYGYSYLLLLFGGLLVVFPFADAHSICSSTSTYPRPPFFSILGFASILAWFIIPTATGDINAFYEFPLRAYWQKIILLFTLRWFTLRFL